MPAEWEPHSATWLAWPHNPETWPGCLEEAEGAFRAMVEALFTGERVCVLVQGDAHAERVRKILAGAPADLHVVETDDSWMRDTGPTFVREDDGIVAIDWTFNAWGGKYPPWRRDDAAASAVARLAGTPSLRTDLVLEGGAIEVDGEGTLLATRSSVLDPRRNPDLDGAEVERRLGELLGVSRVIWLEGAIEGDDTDGHVDDLARFVAPGRVVCASSEDPADPNRAPLEACAAALRAARDARGRPLEVVELPMPPRIEVDGAALPASYANFYVANRVLLVPQFGVDTDGSALEILGALLPGRRLVPIPSRALVRGLGACHCVTQQQPA
jgi:agmatine deiminase